MAKSLLNAVNEVLKKARVISGDAGALASLTDSARQGAIDVAIQTINEGIDELYSVSNIPMPNELAEGTITLVTSTQGYTLATDLIQLRWPLIDKTNNQYIGQHAGGYEAMLRDDPEQDDTGLPRTGVIRPTDGKLHFDRIPTSEENGNVYTYQYDKELELTVLTDTVPFGNAVFRAMVPAWYQLWKRDMRKNDFDDGLLAFSMGRAARLLTQNQRRTHYSPR